MLKLISDLDFVKNNKLEVSEISKNSQYLLSGENEEYILDIYSKGKFKKILKRFECLKSLNLEFPNVYIYEELEVLNDDCFYRIKKKFKDEKSTFDFQYSYNKGVEIGKCINKFHTTFQSRECGRWAKHYSYRINKILHKYGLGEYRGEFDYIIFDFLDANKYLIKERTSTTIVGINSIKDIVVNLEGCFQFEEDYKILRSDSYFEFIAFNSKIDENKTILAGIIDGYFNFRVPRTFFKLLAMYTIVENLYEILDAEVIDCEGLKQKIDDINEIYDKFSSIYPVWYLEVKNKIKE